jgi:malate dehydrogenase (oxaloacetate-decarboxylating)(NADP+)
MIANISQDGDCANQGNNVYILPAVCKAIFTTEATGVIDEMCIVAARGVAEQVSDHSLATRLAYPPQILIREVSLHIAARVAGYIFDKKLAWVPKPDDTGSWSRGCAYHPN